MEERVGGGIYESDEKLLYYIIALFFEVSCECIILLISLSKRAPQAMLTCESSLSFDLM